MKKIRTVKGPLGGRSYTTTLAGQNTIVLVGAKRMTRKKKWEYMRDNANFGIYAGGVPRVRATYQIAMRHVNVGNGAVYTPCMHPDGSFFYEYVEGSSYEY